MVKRLNSKVSEGLGSSRLPLASAGLLMAVAAVGCSEGPVGRRATSARAELVANSEAKHNLLRNATFEQASSLPWLTNSSAPAQVSSDVEDGALCMTIEDRGKNNWDVQFVQRGMELVQGHTYTFDFRAWSSKPTKIGPKVGMSGSPYREDWRQLVTLNDQKRRFVGKFTMSRPTDKTPEVSFHMGGPLTTKDLPVTVCIDDVYLTDPQFDAPPPEVVAPVPKVAVNQMGYLPQLDKFAVLESDATDPLGWQLRSEGGEVVAEGETSPFGPDKHSGNAVHRIDFSSYTDAGKSFTLRVGDDESHPFDIGADIYATLKYDALSYFYHNRSGIAIEMPYAGHERWTRPAGHLGDAATPCAADVGCDYTLDVAGGWYDAGDHGKYVVNGGFSAWTLLNQWERLEHLGRSKGEFADGKMQIPEAGNGVEDLLDEARWEVEFLMKMQVPDGQEFAGLVHHKMHDEGWTAIGMRPDQDTLKRSLRPTSTAATLNTAAVAAQAARIWKKRDAAFSRRALEVARKAYAAAKKFPERYADPKDNDNGGGPYSDDYLTDEFYWAAAELFITTGETQYRKDLRANPHHTELRRGDGAFSILTWETTDSLGLISLATVPSKLSRSDRRRARKRLTGVADLYLENQKQEGYRTPLDPSTEEGTPSYPWGSNSFVMTNAMVMALAYDFTGEDKYRNGVVAAVDYLLGVNPLGQSYVTGYGEKPLVNPHHRFWAKQMRADFPEAPPGAISGGPNSALQDPYVQAAGLKKVGCAPQKCFMDHIESWSTNEITINWNSPFAWVVAFLDEQGH